jgi:excisionase family DNA binding protein
MRERLLTFNEASVALNVSVATVKRRVRQGALPVFADGRIRRIPESAIVRYVAERTFKGRADEKHPGAPVGCPLESRDRLWN